MRYVKGLIVGICLSFFCLGDAACANTVLAPDMSGVVATDALSDSGSSVQSATEAAELSILPMGSTETQSWQFSIAVGHGIAENPLEQANNIKTAILPSWHYYSDNFYLDNFSLGYSLIESSDLEVDLQTRVNDDGLFYELNGLAKLLVSDLYYKVPLRQPLRRPEILPDITRNISYLGGITITFPTDVLTISMGHYHDLTSVHNGAETVIRLNQIFPFLNGRVGIEAGWTRKNTALVDYYYRLTPAEMGKSDFEQFTNASQNCHLRAVVNLPIYQKWYGLLTYERNWLGQGIRRSYLIDKSQYDIVFVGLGYDF